MKFFKVVSSVVILFILILSIFISCDDPMVLPEYTITFDAQEGSDLSSDTKLVTFSSTYGTLPTAIKDGKVFKGWFTEPNGSGDKITSETLVDITADQTLYAWWDTGVITVTFDAQGGSDLSSDTKLVTFGSPYGTLPTATKEGKVFKGWFTEPNGYGDKITSETLVATTVDQTLYAWWNTFIGVTVTFKLDHGITSDSTTKIVPYNDLYGELPTVTRVGYTFVKWVTLNFEEEKVITPTTTVTTSGAHDVTAIWAANTYTVSFDANGGTAASFLTKEVTSGEVYGELPTTSRVHYDFIGWSDENGGLVEASDGFVRGENVTLHAAWKFVPFIGPAGGWVFYENPDYATDTWRYLEAAPYGWSDGNEDPLVQWGVMHRDISPSALGIAVGTGYTNSANIVTYHNTLINEIESTNYYTDPTEYYALNDGTVAAKICTDYIESQNGVIYDDWFLPSRDEIGLLFNVLIKTEYDVDEAEKVYKFTQESEYWTSTDSSFTSASTIDHSFAWYMSTHLSGDEGYEYGSRKETDRYQSHRVRPIRAY